MNKKQRVANIDDRIRVAYQLRTIMGVPRDLFYHSIWLWPAPNAPPIEGFLSAPPEMFKAYKSDPLQYLNYFRTNVDTGYTLAKLVQVDRRIVLFRGCVSCALEHCPQNNISGYLYCDSCAEWLKRNE